MAKCPLIGLNIAFCSGIISAAFIRAPLLAFYSAAFLFLIFCIIFIKQNTKFNIFLFCAVFFLGGALFRNSQVLPDCHIAKLIPYKSELVPLIGVIDNDPIYQGRNVSFILRAEKAGIGGFWQETCGKVLVRLFKKGTFSYGDRLFLKGNLYRPFSFSKEFDYRNYLKHQNVYLILSAGEGSGMVRLLGEKAGNPLVFFSFRIKHRLRGVIVNNLSPFSAGILNALILGDRQDLSGHFLDILMKLGTIHILPRLYTKMPSVAL